MAKLQLKVNGAVVEKNVTTLEFLQDVMTTKDPGAKTVTTAVNNALKAKPGYFKTFAATYKPSDTLEIIIDEKPAAQYVAGNLLRKMEISADFSKWNGVIFTEKSDKKNNADKGELEA